MSSQLPDGWREVKLGDVAKVVAGQSPKGIFYNDVCDGMPFYQGKTEFGETYLDKPKKWTTQVTKLAQAGDILMSVRAPVGVINLTRHKICIGRGLASIRAQGIERMFLFFYLHTVQIVGNGGSVFDSITKEQIEKLKIVAPTLPEQKAIAGILQKWEEAIEQTEALIAAKQKQFEWLLKRLISDQQGGPGWRDIKLGEVGKIHSGGTPSTKEQANWGGDIFWLTPTEVTKLPGKFIFSTDRTITKRALSQTTLLPPNCLIVCTRATLGECCINKVPMAINQGFKCIEPYDEFDVIFLYYAMQISSGKLLQLASGNTFGEVSKKDFANIVLTLPSLSEQKAIAHILNTAQREISLLKQLTDRYRTQKRGLMQKLLTGEWRVK